MYFIDELMSCRMYKKPFYLPINMKDKRHNSCALLMCTDSNSVKHFLTHPLFTNKYYNAYYLEKSVMYYINQESGKMELTDDTYITEDINIYKEDKYKFNISMSGYAIDIDTAKKYITKAALQKIADDYDVKLPDIVRVSIARAGVKTFDYSNNTMNIASYSIFNKKSFGSYQTYCEFCMHCYVMYLANPNIDERLLAGVALYECGVYGKNKDKSEWPFAYSLKLVGRSVDIYISTNSHAGFVRNVIKSNNGLSKLELSPSQIIDAIVDNHISTVFGEDAKISTDYTGGFLQLSENTAIVFEDASQNLNIKKALYDDRIKSGKELIEMYKGLKSEFSDIKYTYTDLSMYKSLNLFFDLSWYNNSFVKNNILKNKKGYDLYIELMSRMIDDFRLKENGYIKNTVVIPVLDWVTDITKDPWFIKDSITPISCIYYSLYNGDGKIKEIFKGKTILFMGEKSYFTMKTDEISDDKEYLRKFMRCIRSIISKEEVLDDNDPKDSEAAITVNIVDKVEKSQNVKINNLDTSNTEDSQKVVNSNDSSINTDADKKELVKSVAAAAKGKNSEEDAINALENDEKIRQTLSNLAANPDNGVDMSAARSSRMLKLQNDFLDSKFNNATVKELITANAVEAEVKPISLHIDSVNPEWENLSYASSVSSYNLDADIVDIFRSFIDVSRPLAVLELDAEDTSTSEDAIITYTCKYEDYRGTRYTIVVDIPKVLDGKYFKLRGNRKTIQPQLLLMPIIKTEEDTVQIVSCYKKIYMSRFGSTAGKSNVFAGKLLKALSKHEYKTISYTEGDNSRVCSKYELPIDYIDIASSISKIITKSYTFYFNQDELREMYEVDDSKGLPIGINNKTKEIQYYNTSDFFAYYLYLLIATDSEGEDFVKNFNNAAESVRYTYTRASILDTKIPLVVICGYHIGLEETMRRAGIKYTLYSDKKPSKSADKDIIKLKDGWIEYDLNYASSLLMNGLRACNIDEVSINDINKKYTYIDFLELFGGRILSDGLDNFYDCMVDPITKGTAEHYKLPTDYIDMLLYANSLLADNKYVKHGNIRSTRRIRRIEQIADFLYKELSRSYGSYSTGIKHGRNIDFSVKRAAVIDAFLTNNTSSDQSILNALGEYEDYNAATPKGASGMNSDRAYSLDKRSFDESMINVMSTSTGFAGNVGITRQLTIDANVSGPRGYIVNDPDMSSGELNGVKALCMTEALTPFGTTRDDPMRVAMNFVQTSKHFMRTEKQGPLLITNGADEALPFLVSDTFAFKAKSNGKVVTITDDFMILEYKDGSRDFVSLDNNVMKNSSSGFYVTIKLSTKLKEGSTFKEGDIVAYDESSFCDSVGTTDNISYSLGPMTKFAIMNASEGYEDSAIVTAGLSEDLASDVVILEHGRGFVIPKDADIFNFIKKGQFVKEGDELFTLQNAYDDEEANALLRALKSDNDVLSAGRVTIKAGHTGIVEDIVIKRTVDIDELSPTLKKIVSDYEKNINLQKKVLKNNNVEDVNHSIPDTGILPATGKLKSAQDSIYIEIYIKYHDKFGTGDKLIYGAAVKGVDAEVIPYGKEPRSSYRPDEKVDSILAIGSLNARMVASVQTRGLINKGLIELTRQCKEICGIPTDLNKK